MFRISFTAPGIAALALLLARRATAGQIYSFKSFDGPGNNGGGTTVNGINNNGEVVGFASDNAGTPTLFTNFIRGANGIFTPIGLNGDPLAMANGINSPRTVVGASSNGTSFQLTGVFTTLPPVNVTTVAQAAFGINDGGFIVGQFTDGATDMVPGFLFSGGAYTILQPTVVATVTNAQGVNNHGVVTGFWSADGVHQHGFFYSSATNSFTLPPDPNVPKLVLTQFLGINDLGLAVGYYQIPDGSQHGFLYDTNTHTYSFLDDPSAALSGVSITQITGINNSDEITGFYVDAATGLQRGFIAAPVSNAPEPGTLGLLLGGLMPVLMAGRRRVGRAVHGAKLKAP